MILVTLGTQKQQFNRLLDYIENSKIKEKIVVQAGYTKYTSKKMEIFDFIDFDEMEKLINESDLIITHGGTGSIITPLKKGKKIIACSRLEKNGEHVDNHQTELVSIFSKEGYILELNETNNIDDLYKSIKKFKPKKYKENTKNFIDKLEKEIQKIIKKNYMI